MMISRGLNGAGYVGIMASRIAPLCCTRAERRTDIGYAGSVVSMYIGEAPQDSKRLDCSWVCIHDVAFVVGMLLLALRAKIRRGRLHLSRSGSGCAQDLLLFIGVLLLLLGLRAKMRRAVTICLEHFHDLLPTRIVVSGIVIGAVELEVFWEVVARRLDLCAQVA